MKKVFVPLASKVYWKKGESTLDFHHSFTVEYGDGKDKKLFKHLMTI